MLTGLLIAILIVAALATTAAGGAVLAQRRQRLSGAARKQLTTGSGGEPLERTVRELRVDDVVMYEGRDYVVDGVLDYDEDGHRWCAGRLLDGADRRWLVAGLERGGALVVRLMDEDASVEIEGFPPEVLTVAGERFKLERRGTATARASGDTGVIRPAVVGAESVERCRWWLYETPGDGTLLVEQWGAVFRVLRGLKLDPALLELMQGS